MNEKIQRRQIVRFLKRRTSRQVDEFCLYQWLDRCYYQGWWELGAQLASCMPPGSLNPEYRKRISFLSYECRHELNDKFVEVKNPAGKKSFWIPQIFWNICENLGLSLSGTSDRWLRFNRKTDRVAIIGRIRPDECSFKISKRDKNAICAMLRENGFEYLGNSLGSKEDTRSRRSWLRVSWADATRLIPLWADFAQRNHKVKHEEALLIKKNYLGFWKELLDAFKVRLPDITKQNPGNRSHISIPSGHQRIHFEWYFRQSKKLFCVSIHFEYPEGEKNKRIFDYFYGQRDNVKKSFPEEEIVFEREWGKRWAQIIIGRPSVALDEDNIKWGVEKMTQFYRTFKPLLDNYFLK